MDDTLISPGGKSEGRNGTMNTAQLRALTLRQTDVEGAVNRLCGNEELYIMCLREFLADPTMGELNRAIGVSSWDEAFTAAHALKGLAGNLGFIPLMHSIGQLVVLIRGGRISEINEVMHQVNSSYRDIVDAIDSCFGDKQ